MTNLTALLDEINAVEDTLAELEEHAERIKETNNGMWARWDVYGGCYEAVVMLSDKLYAEYMATLDDIDYFQYTFEVLADEFRKAVQVW